MFFDSPCLLFVYIFRWFRDSVSSGLNMGQADFLILIFANGIFTDSTAFGSCNQPETAAKNVSIDLSKSSPDEIQQRTLQGRGSNLLCSFGLEQVRKVLTAKDQSKGD